MSLFPMAVLTLFYEQKIGMTMADILLLQGFFGLVLALFEFPSGYVADRLGYRYSLIAGATLGSLGWGAYALATTLFGVVIAEALLGIALSLISGTNRALMYESLLATGEESTFNIWESRLQFWGQFSEGTCALAAGLLYVISPSLPFWVTAGANITMIVLAWNMVESDRGHHPAIENHFAHAWSMVKHVFTEAPALRAIFLVSVSLGMVSFVPVWTVPLYAIDAGVPEAWLGPIWSIANYTVAVFALVSPRLEKRWGVVGLLTLCVALIPIGYFGMGLTHAWWGFAFYFVLTALRGLRNPVLSHVENRLIPSSDRAGFLSMRSLFFRLSFLALAPIVGFSVDSHGQHLVFLVLGVAFSVVCALALLAYSNATKTNLLRKNTADPQ